MLTGMDVIYINNAVYAKLEAEGLLTKINEIYALKDLDQDQDISFSEGGTSLFVTTSGITLEITNSSIVRIE